MTPKQKIGRSMREIRDALNELDKTVKMNLKLKTELKMKSEDYWKNTHKALTKISERLVKMANKVGNLIMKQVIVDYIPFSITPTQINEALKENNGKLVVKGVLQRAEAKNQNGRVYPREILVREAKKYDENFVKQNRALGELDHLIVQLLIYKMFLTMSRICILKVIT